MSVYFALLMWLTGGKSIYALPDWWSTRVVLFQTEAANGDLVRITLPILVAALAALADLAPDDPQLPPAGSSPRWAAIPRRRAGSASTSPPCISWPTAISA